MLALLLASNDVFMNCLDAFLLAICCARVTREPLPDVLFMTPGPAAINAELLRSMDELTVFCNGCPMLWFNAPLAYWIPAGFPAPAAELKAWALMRIAA